MTSIEIAKSRELANKVKLHERVLVAIGNPPHDKAPKGAGKWVETGEGGPTENAPLDAFRLPGNGRYEYVLANMHVHFWRWATWKVFEYHQDAPTGIVALISPSAYLTGRGFAGMRTYLRQTADEGWIIDLSPEGHQPDVATRIFPEVQQPLCIGIFLRRGPPQPHTPGMIHYIAVSWRQREKFDRLGELRFDGPGWATCPAGLQAPFMPELDRAWTDSPPLDDLFPWSSRGVTPGRTWVYAPDRETLALRWRQFIAATVDQRRHLLREAPPDRKLNSVVGPLPGITPHSRTLAEETAETPLEPVPIGHRSFDRKWAIPDNRLMVRPRPDLWRVRGPKQIYMTQSVHPLTCGPALTFTACIPDMHHYNGRSGRAIPLYRDAKSTAPNLAPKLLSYLAQRLDMRLEPEDILAYVAAIAAHPAYTERFLEQLRVPGVRVPLSDDRTLWAQAIRLGRRVLWLHTYGERCIDPAADQPEGPHGCPRNAASTWSRSPTPRRGCPRPSPTIRQRRHCTSAQAGSGQCPRRSGRTRSPAGVSSNDGSTIANATREAGVPPNSTTSSGSAGRRPTPPSSSTSCRCSVSWSTSSLTRQRFSTGSALALRSPPRSSRQPPSSLRPRAHVGHSSSRAPPSWISTPETSLSGVRYGCLLLVVLDDFVHPRKQEEPVRQPRP